ncbi:hypothetical protein GTR04_1535 [Trichophyton interdigitale]|nr:hypothetical protein GTR04_1535 [Trichophyton interdigitale]
MLLLLLLLLLCSSSSSSSSFAFALFIFLLPDDPKPSKASQTAERSYTGSPVGKQIIKPPPVPFCSPAAALCPVRDLVTATLALLISFRNGTRRSFVIANGGAYQDSYAPSPASYSRSTHPLPPSLLATSKGDSRFIYRSVGVGRLEGRIITNGLSTISAVRLRGSNGVRAPRRPYTSSLLCLLFPLFWSAPFTLLSHDR